MYQAKTRNTPISSYIMPTIELCRDVTYCSFSKVFSRNRAMV